MKSENLFSEPVDSFVAYEGSLNFCLNKLMKIPGMMILFCTGGAGQIMLDFKEYTLVERSQLTVVAASTMMVLHASPDFQVSLVLFPPPVLIELGAQIDHSLIAFVKTHPHYTHPIGRDSLMFGIFRCMVDVYKDQENRYRDQMARNLLMNFFLDLYDKLDRYLNKVDFGITSRQEELFRRFKSLLYDHSSVEREVRFYAERLCITPRYLTLISRQMVGKTAKEVVDEHVVVEIKILLQSTNLSMKEIVERLHLPDTSFMGKYFRKHTGMTPLEYRNA